MTHTSGITTHGEVPATTAGKPEGIGSCVTEELPDYALIGKRRFRFSSYSGASKAYTDAIEATGATVSGRTGPAAPHCVFMKRIYDEDYCVGHVSYNGNVWRYEPHDLADHRLHKMVWSPSATMPL